MTAPVATLQEIRLQNTTDGHHKEYRIDVGAYDEATVTVSWGRIGYVNQSQTREFLNGTYALEWAEEKLSEKIDGGYVVVDDATAAGPMECALTERPAQATERVDDDRTYLVAGYDCNGDWLGLQQAADGGLHSAQVTGSQALLDLLCATKTGWYRPVDGEPDVFRHRVQRFVVVNLPDGGEETYRRVGGGLVLTPGGVLLLGCAYCGHATDEGELRVWPAGAMCDVCSERQQ